MIIPGGVAALSHSDVPFSRSCMTPTGKAPGAVLAILISPPNETGAHRRSTPQRPAPWRHPTKPAEPGHVHDRLLVRAAVPSGARQARGPRCCLRPVRQPSRESSVTSYSSSHAAPRLHRPRQPPPTGACRRRATARAVTQHPGMEALATAKHLQAEVFLSAASPRLQEALTREGITAQLGG